MAFDGTPSTPKGLRLAAAGGLPGFLLALAAALIGSVPLPVEAPSGFAGTLAGVGWHALLAAPSAPFLAMLVALLAARAGGAHPSPGAAAGGAWRLWIAGLIYAFVVSFGLACLLVPGLLLSIAFVLYAPAAVLERAGPVHALTLGYARARRGWGEVVGRIAGPYVFYGVVYAFGAAPAVQAGARAAARVLASPSSPGRAGIDGIVHAALSATAPPWFRWGVMPLLFAAAQLYLLAGVTSAWLTLGRSAPLTPRSPPPGR